MECVARSMGFDAFIQTVYTDVYLQEDMGNSLIL